MAKSVIEAKLTNRTDRARLLPGDHYRGIDPDVHLLYRKGKRGGVWGVRLYLGVGQYRREKLGTADDIIAEGNLDFDAACRAARDLVAQWRREETAKAAGPILTVRLAVTRYAEHRASRAAARNEGRTTKTSASCMVTHVLAFVELADTPLSKLRVSQLTEWRAARTGKVSSRKKVTTDFKAALMAAAPNSEIKDIIREGLATPGAEIELGGDEARENQIRTDDEIRKIIDAARDYGDDDLFVLIVVLAATGARFSQIIRMRVRDVQGNRLIIPAARKGRGRVDAKKPIPVPVTPDVIEALLPFVQGRKAGDLLLMRWKKAQTTIGTWENSERVCWIQSAEMRKGWDAIVASVGLPGVIPYALRHSWIVRMVRQGMPTPLVAKLADTSVEMIEHHYGRHIADGLDDLAARMAIPMVPNRKPDNVVALRTK